MGPSETKHHTTTTTATYALTDEKLIELLTIIDTLAGSIEASGGVWRKFKPEISTTNFKEVLNTISAAEPSLHLSRNELEELNTLFTKLVLRYRKQYEAIPHSESTASLQENNSESDQLYYALLFAQLINGSFTLAAIAFTLNLLEDTALLEKFNNTASWFIPILIVWIATSGTITHLYLEEQKNKHS